MVEKSEIRWQLIRALSTAYFTVAGHYLPRVITVSEAATVKEVAQDVYDDWRAQGAEMAIRQAALNLGIKYPYVRQTARGMFRGSLQGK